MTAASQHQERPHPLLVVAFQALDAAGIPWLLMRGSDDLARPRGDVDLLAGRAGPELDRALERAGFRRITAPGHGSHQFYFAYDIDNDLWLKLDVVTDIAFGRFQQWRTPLSPDCLRRRVRSDGLARPTTSDEAWLLLLHLTLDKDQIPSARVDYCRAAGSVADPADPIAVTLDHLAGAGTSTDLLSAVRDGPLEGTCDVAGAIRHRLTAQSPLRSRVRAVTNRALRRVASPTMSGRPFSGLKVAVMGPDGAGKTTLLDGIGRDFPAASNYVYMGLWSETRWDQLLRRLPGARLTQKLARVCRGSLLARYHSARGRLVLLDRVPYDAMLPGSIDRSIGGRLVAAAVLAMSPRPDLLLVLDAPGTVMYARKGEHSVAILEGWRQSYLELAESVPNSTVLDATQPADDVKRHAIQVIWQQFATIRPELTTAQHHLQNPSST